MKCVYLRKNKVNGMLYVGQTNNIHRRNYEFNNLNKKYSNDIIDSDREKYGINAFELFILQECKTKDELDRWERHYVKFFNTKYPNGYNVSDGGKGCSGWVMPEEQKKRLSEQRIGDKNPMYNVKPWNTGKKWSDENRKKISEGLKGKTKGRKKSEDHKRKIGLAHSKPIIQVFEDGTTKEWESAADAGRNGYNYSHICSCCRGERNKHKKCKWYFQDEYMKKC